MTDEVRHVTPVRRTVGSGPVVQPPVRGGVVCAEEEGGPVRPLRPPEVRPRRPVRSVNGETKGEKGTRGPETVGGYG